MKLKVNDIAPNFSLEDQDGKLHSLAQYLGKKVVLYFYPKDDTPGCTKEACSFRDHQAALTGKNVVVLGVSMDSVESHKKFEEKYSLSFPLLADGKKEAVTPYGVYGEKMSFGKVRMGITRKTFLIGVDGRIEKIYSKVSTETHAADIIADWGL